MGASLNCEGTRGNNNDDDEDNASRCLTAALSCSQPDRPDQEGNRQMPAPGPRRRMAQPRLTSPAGRPSWRKSTGSKRVVPGRRPAGRGSQPQVHVRLDGQLRRVGLQAGLGQVDRRGARLLRLWLRGRPGRRLAVGDDHLSAYSPSWASQLTSWVTWAALL
jgi:hypothetical protein